MSTGACCGHRGFARVELLHNVNVSTGATGARRVAGAVAEGVKRDRAEPDTAPCMGDATNAWIEPCGVQLAGHQAFGLPQRRSSMGSTDSPPHAVARGAAGHCEVGAQQPLEMMQRQRQQQQPQPQSQATMPGPQAPLLQSLLAGVGSITKHQQQQQEEQQAPAVNHYMHAMLQQLLGVAGSAGSSVGAAGHPAQSVTTDHCPTPQYGLDHATPQVVRHSSVAGTGNMPPPQHAQHAQHAMPPAVYNNLEDSSQHHNTWAACNALAEACMPATVAPEPQSMRPPAPRFQPQCADECMNDMRLRGGGQAPSGVSGQAHTGATSSGANANSHSGQEGSGAVEGGGAHAGGVDQHPPRGTPPSMRDSVHAFGARGGGAAGAGPSGTTDIHKARNLQRSGSGYEGAPQGIGHQARLKQAGGEGRKGEARLQQWPWADDVLLQIDHAKWAKLVATGELPAM